MKDRVNRTRDDPKIKQNLFARRSIAAVPIAIDQRRIVGQDLLLDRVWRCITDQENNKGIIGIYGTGGVGKTTLLKQVNNKFCSEEHDFHVVIWSVVSRQPNLEQIQEDIGKRIGLGDIGDIGERMGLGDIGERMGFPKNSWKDKGLEEKARDITNTLQHKKFVLLLDDIWESKINLTELGVPLQRLQFGSKIVFTTRFHGTCGKMGAEERFDVSYLGDDDAWELFRRVVGKYVLGKHPDIPELAKAMARQCHGLPLALETVGNAMASKEYPGEWRHAIQIISTSASEFEDMEKQVFSCLKFSYDSLPNGEYRSCLLYCCLFPEDTEILKTDLIEYWKSEGFVDSNDGWDGVLGRLVGACLLDDEGDHVKVHDMIRAMVLWAEKENCWVPPRTEAPKFEEWQGYKRISLMKGEIQSLPEIPSCPRLLTLLLDQNCIAEIADGFFQSFPSLRVLNLSRNPSLTELPAGISSLVSLHHLDLSWTSLRRLPEELKALVNLRYLNLDYIIHMTRIPKQLLSSFSKLQVLMMLHCGLNEAKEGGALSEDAEPLMKELLCLVRLNVISFTLHGSRAIRIFLKYKKLVSITQSLLIQDCKSPPLNPLNLADMKQLNELHIMSSKLEEFKSTGEVRKVLSGFCSVHTIKILLCEVKDLTWLAFLPNLKDLRIVLCFGLKKIVSVEKLSEVSEVMEELNLFAKLESLSIFGVENLECICWNPLPFPQLKKIEVRECPKLNKLPLNSISAQERQIVIEGENEWWEALEWEDEATKNAFSTCFVPSKQQEEFE